MTSQSSLDSLVAEILTEIRLRTNSPSEGINVLGLSLYMLWQQTKINDDFYGFMADFDTAMASLHLANDIKGTA